jgi:outer membrane protein TolC
MKQFLIILTGLNLLLMNALSQSINLSQCLEKGRNNYPLLAGKNYLQTATSLKLKNLQAQYYPQIDLTGQLTWQNDVTHLSASNPMFKVETPAKDQYKAYIDVKQVIYDGGMISASKKLEEIKGETDQQSIEIDLYAIRNRIIDTYFLILSIDKQREQIKLSIDDLTNRFNESKAKVKNGATLQSNVDLLIAELLKLQQTQASLNEGKTAALEILSEFTGDQLNTETSFEIPFIATNDTLVNRPELLLMQKQREQIDAIENVGNKNRMPRLSAFGQMGYGNPGYNMMLNSFEPFYMVGLRLNWSVWDWQKNSRDKKSLQQQQLMIDTKEQAFLKQINLSKSEIESRIRRTKISLQLDQKIIQLRENIRLASLAQLDNGIITSADYISRLNDASMARLNEALHQIELSKANVELANLLGNAL